MACGRKNGVNGSKCSSRPMEREGTRELETSKQEMEKGLLDHGRNVGLEAQIGLKLFLLFLLSSQG